MKSTYQFLFDNCYELYSREFQTEHENTSEAAEGPNSTKSLEFWHKLIALVVSVIEEDKTSYTSVLNQLAFFHLLIFTYSNIYKYFFLFILHLQLHFFIQVSADTIF